MESVNYWITFVANCLTALASSIAIYLFFVHKEKISSAFNMLLNYSKQLTLSDLKYKIERLNDFNVSVETQVTEVINILNEIEGQINGNIFLKDKLSDQLSKLNEFTTNPKKLTEPRKRSLVSELREVVRNIDASNFNDIANNKNT